MSKSWSPGAVWLALAVATSRKQGVLACGNFVQPVHVSQHLYMFHNTCTMFTKKAIACVRQLLIETRVRLVTGLKRYLHTKHGEGLLSAASVQVRPCAACPAQGARARDYLQRVFRGRGQCELASIAILSCLPGLCLATLAFLDTRQ